MLPDLFELALVVDDADVPASSAADHVLVRWLRQRLGRRPSWLEVLALRAGLRERALHRVRWAWWRRLRRPTPPGHEDLVADFLRSPEGQMLFRLLDGMSGLLAQLALPDPWKGFDGRHPTALRLSRREALRERVALGCAVPVREQAEAVLAYGEWKRSGVPMVPRSFIPEEAEFVTPVQAAAINALSAGALMDVCARLLRTARAEAGKRAVLRELDCIGVQASERWPGIERRRSGPPLGYWPPDNDQGSLAASTADELLAPAGP